LALLAHETPAHLSNIVASLFTRYISSNAVVLSFRLENQGSTSQTADISISNGISFDGNLSAPVSSIESDDGFVVTSILYAMTFGCWRASLVTCASTYWFGSYVTWLSNNWTQVVNASISGIDSAFTISWQDISVPPGKTVTRSLIATFGVWNADQIILTMYFPDPPAALNYQEQLEFLGIAQSSNVSDLLFLIIVCDGDIIA
jgi:hypothetical protein